MSEPPKAYTISNPRARKEHLCCECCGTIATGEKYHVFSGIWDTAESFKTCAECEILRSEVAELRKRGEPTAFGDLYLDVFESKDGDSKGWIRRFMATRRARNAPESPRRWMEERELELLNTELSRPKGGEKITDET